MVRLLEKSEIASVVTEVMGRAIGQDRIQDPVNVEYASRAFAQNGVVWGLFDNDGVPRGVLVGIITPDLLTSVLTGYEYLWLCELSHRNKHALNLLFTFERYCKEHGCKRVVIGSHAMVDPARRERLYARLNYEPHSQSFSRAL